MPGYYIESSDIKEFDSIESPYISGPEGKWEGKVTRLSYAIQTSAKPASMIQITRNYEAALNKVGAQVLFSDDRAVGVKLHKPGPAWVEVQAYSGGDSYTVLIVEGKVMEQEVIADAAVLRSGISADGKIAVYGIYFDTGKAIVKPESKPTLEQIEKLLKQNPKLNLFVVGHTDADGTAEANLRLSSDRVTSVVQALVKSGIDSTRLAPAGVGQYCPVSTNRSDAGKAKNRRVELVERL